MDKSTAGILSCIIGFILMLVGFVGYMNDPANAYTFVCAAGIVILGASYAYLTILGHNITKIAMSIDRDEAENGFIYYMDGAPVDNGATIIDLTEGSRR